MMLRCHVNKLLSIFLVCSLSATSYASEQSAGDPDPALELDSLTLDKALLIAEVNGSPAIDMAEAEILESSAELASIRSKYGIRVDAELAPRYVYAIDTTVGDDINDSYYFLATRKVLTDFGQTKKLSQAAESDIRAEAIDFVSFRYHQRLQVIRAYMNVLLSDMRYRVDDEKMTIKFLKFDKKRDRHELGEVSDVDLMGLESDYRAELINRMRSANRQSETRAELAALLNRPDQFPGELAPISSSVEDLDIPEYEMLLKRVLDVNPELSAQKERVNAAKARLEHSKMARRPVLDSAVELGNYDRRYGSGGKWRLGLNLRVPFREGGRFKAEVAKREAELQEEEARFKKMKNALRKEVLELVQELDVLRAAVAAANLRLDYRDIYMDRSRSAYELEMETTLGDAAAEMTEAQWHLEKVKFDFLLTLGSVDALQGIDPARRFMESNNE
jgi:outer membrane protein TolC